MVRDVETDIRLALIRGKSSRTVQSVFQLLGQGKLRLWVGDDMSGSCFVSEGVVKIMHVGGRWNDDEARWMFDGMQEYAAEKGLPWQWAGRGSWARFLRMKGFFK